MLKQKQAKSVAVTSKGDSVERTVISRSKTQQPKAHLQAIHTHSSGSNQQSSLPNLSIHQLRAILQENQHLIQSNDFSSPLSIIPNPFGIYLLSFLSSFSIFVLTPITSTRVTFLLPSLILLLLLFPSFLSSLFLSLEFPSVSYFFSLHSPLSLLFISPSFLLYPFLQNFPCLFEWSEKQGKSLYYDIIYFLEDYQLK